MAVNQDYLDYVLEQLSLVPGVEVKRMFGGVGFFKEGIMFAMIGGAVFRLRVDESNQADFEKYDMKPLQPNPNKKGMPYWEVPSHVLEDRDELKEWAEKAFEVAVSNKK